jgi:hypothetical protein
MRTTLRNTLTLVLLCTLAGCSDDPKPEDTGNTQSDDSEDGGASDDNDSDDSNASDSTDEADDSDTTESEATDSADETDETSDETDSNDGLPDPVLEDVNPQTPLSGLTDDQLQEVCDAYLETATSITTNLPGICPAQAVLTASQSMPESDAEAQEACVATETTCDMQVAASQTAIAGADCARAEECGATIADFNACNRQIAALNEMVIVPVGDLNAPECSSLTVSGASGFSTLAGLTVLLGLASAEEAGGGSPTDESGPCQRLQEECPEFGAALDAFEGLQLPEL